MLLRDGTLHFMYVRLCRSALSRLCSSTQNRYSASASIFLVPMTSILVSRFILNLCQVSLGSVGLNTISHSTLNTPDLPSRLLGNIGAELQNTSLVFEDIEDNMEDEQGITEGCETYELAQVQ
ncbi:uncharacterized protein LAESUDRAFT_431460 [Laetiporus sulphureus 93-53]|uniref:Uncharacterized protein n=1 Tax=Laetiporus sulphureus 93-53 TaxID=1314785 RepID=A0A165C4Z5_9APHY|nr:uncharacterized protein LAESUDRAFT_431460 [Laetiporus sulphureus 93-53]KZT02213.1 hypothetical protein LAESUDRAFT_431460 [Laetiporus sulphureus 93-53]